MIELSFKASAIVPIPLALMLAPPCKRIPRSIVNELSRDTQQQKGATYKHFLPAQHVLCSGSASMHLQFSQLPEKYIFRVWMLVEKHNK